MAVADRFDPARWTVPQDHRAVARAARAYRDRPTGCACAATVVRIVPGGRRGQPRVRFGSGLGAGALRVSGTPVVRRHRRHSICVADRRRRNRADQSLRGKRLARRTARSARHPGRLHAARHFRRAGFRWPAFRGANRAAGIGGSGSRAGGGGRDAWRLALDHDPPRHLPRHPAGAAHRLRARLCPRGRGIRLGHLHRGQPSECLGNRAAPDRHSRWRSSVMPTPPPLPR